VSVAADVGVLALDSWKTERQEEKFQFSKKLDNHIGAIKYFICHDNLAKIAV
jgi:hypothetical protein